MRTSTTATIAAVVGVAVAVLTGPVGSSDAAPNTDWAGYEHGPAHSSAAFNDTAITVANVPSLHVAWSFTAGASTQAGAPGPKFDSSPTVVGGHVYIGSRTGIFYNLDATTGAVVWKKQLDFGSATVCSAKGIVGTATVAADPVSGTLTVYAAGSHYLYALNAATGAQVWKVAIGPATAAGEARWYNWSSPSVVGGKIYMGLAAACDANKVRGGVVQVDQHTGKKNHTWYAVPAGNHRAERVEQHGRRRHLRLGHHREPGPVAPRRSTTRSRSCGCRPPPWQSWTSGPFRRRSPTTSTSAARRPSSPRHWPGRRPT